jgi:type VI secretion system secreted protein Hcp
MSIYMQLGDVEGEVTTMGFEKQIEIMSVSFGTARNIASPARKANGRESSEPMLSEMNLTKEWDSTSSVKLFEELIPGKLNLKALLTFTTTSEGSVEKYLEIELTDVGISNFQINGSGEDKPSESLALNFAKIMYKPFVVGADKTAKTGKIVTYDLTVRRTVAKGSYGA